ncbi:MAG: NAD(P)H-hydrate epimerase [Nitrososphaeraceae archaeon]
MTRQRMIKERYASEEAISSDQMYTIEDKAHNLIGMKRIYMMENAGHGVADFIILKFKRKLRGKQIVAICGTGNNGGDGFVASRHLSYYYGARLRLVLLGFPNDLRTEEARINWEIIQKMDSIETTFGYEINDEIRMNIENADVIIDGIFGTGIRGEIREPHSSAIELINKSKAYIVSVDVPSGIDPNSGRAHDKSVKADATVTFHRMKKGLLNNKKYTGVIHVEKIGIPHESERGVV